jgi:hypothetical protein
LKEESGSHSGKTSNRFVVKTLVVGTLHITRKVLQSETGSVGGGDQRWFRRNTREERI